MPSRDNEVIQEVMAERDLAGQKQRESERLLSVTLRGIGDAVLVTDVAGRVAFMNAVAEELTGWLEAEARGKEASRVFVILAEETREAIASPIERVLREGVIVGLADHTLLIARDGTERAI